MCDYRIMLESAKEKYPQAVLFLNSNKSECNIRKKAAKSRLRCYSLGININHDIIVSKGPDRDIDRDAVNLLIGLLLKGVHEIVAVERLTDLTEDLLDLEEFLTDAKSIGVNVLELSTMRICHHANFESGANESTKVSLGK